jgi:curved DNA-binding protein
MPVAYRDYYELLGVDRDAASEDIRRAYRSLARRYHPDVSKEPDADERFKEISEAYEVLRDPEKRERYDQLGPNWRAGQDVSGTSGFRRGADGFGGRAPGGFGQGGFSDVRVGFGGDDFSDFFEGLFGRGGAGGGGRRGGFDGFSSRGADQEATVELSLEEAARGGRRRITLDDGRDYELNVPPGVRDGQLIRLAGEGFPGVAGGPPGDLLLRVRLRPHPRFRLEGRDLHVDVPVATWEAALGASVDVHTLAGTRQVRVPAGSSCGRRLRLRAAGMPNPRGEDGNLYAHVQIRLPRHLDDDERYLYERLRDVSDFDPRARR